MMHFLTTLFLLLFLPFHTLYPFITATTELLDNNTEKITISFASKPENFIYKDSIIISVDSPEITLQPWTTSHEPVARYDEISKETKNVFIEDFTLTIIAKHSETKKNDESASLHIAYQVNNEVTPHTSIVPLHVGTPNQADILDQPGELSPLEPEPTRDDLRKIPVSEKKTITQYFWDFSSAISRLVKQTESTPIRLFLVFILGILLSLTPCIYPMIPITIGILQAQRSSSLLYNFLLALFYTLGLATTFACFGLIASASGPLYGKLLVHPLAVTCIIIVLLYLALSMFGLYELHIPRFLQSPNSVTSNGSLLSAFLFGAASGTIASPCISPGLALLLSIVATMGNTFLGFLLLFFFGIGLSTPLLIVGTFSNSLALLPKTGAWMVEIKKIFGVMLVWACLYYLHNIVSMHTTLFISAITTALLGLYYLYNNQTTTLMWKKINIALGMLFIATTVILLSQSFKYYYQSTTIQTNSWLTSYDDALHKAQEQNTLLFIDVWAQFCSICKAINNTVLSKPEVEAVLNKYVLLNVDGTHEDTELYQTIIKKYPTLGFPTFLLVDPNSETVIKQWGGELYNMPLELVIKELQRL